jgi:hypothetical protein
MHHRVTLQSVPHPLELKSAAERVHMPFIIESENTGFIAALQRKEDNQSSCALVLNKGKEDLEWILQPTNPLWNRYA